MRRVAATVGAEAVEEAYDLILPQVPQGVFERDLGAGRVELFWYGSPDSVPGIAVTATEAPDDPLERRRLDGVVRVAGGFALRAPGDPPAPPGTIELVVAGHGFGTGAHPTTRACLELIAGLDPAGAFADLGAGSGVLAIAAARLGFGPVIAADHAQDALEAIAANAAANSVYLDIRRLDLASEPPPETPTVAANVPLHIHEALAGRLRATALVASGVRPRAADRLAPLYGMRETARIEEEGWAATLLTRS